MIQLFLNKVQKFYGDFEVLKGVQLEVVNGEFVVFVGPSGCGKSTLLRMIAGLDSTSSGDIIIDGVRVNDLPPVKRGIAMVFQSYALYPHMTVFENIAFPLRVEKMEESKLKAKVENAARILHLEQRLQQKPGMLSGGQRQRVAIGRAIVREPTLFLFDEPLSNLDAALRVNMRLEISELHAQLKTTMIYVTHDQVEAMTMADKIVVLNRGNIEQVGSPLELYSNPRNMFVAGFIGSPKMNFLGGAHAAQHGAATIGVRPEHLTLSTTDGPLKGTAGVSEHLGSDTFVHVKMESGESVTARVPGDYRVRHGDPVWLTPDTAHLHRFDAQGLAVKA